MSLHIADNLELPDEAVTQTFAILAKRGVGKTYTASVMVEEMLENNMHVIVIDPIGVWWGLRTSADGQSEGLPIVIAGGDHADIPLQVEAGEVLAGLIIDNRMSIVIDLSLFRKNEQTRFMTDFAEAIYRKNRNAVHIVLDEADAFAPQRPFGNEARMLGAIEDIVRRGRARGIGVTMITQRPAVLNKNVLTQIEVLVALRLTAPADQKAIDDWVKTHAEGAQRDTFMSSLPSLPVGTAWFWSPGWLELFEKVKVRTRKTLDSSSTPKVGQQVASQHVMAAVDLAAISKQLSDSVTKIDENDPKKLQAEVKRLREELETKEANTIVAQVEVLPAGFKNYIKGLHSEAHLLTIKISEAMDFCSKFSEASDTDSQFKEPGNKLVTLPDGAQAIVIEAGKPPINKPTPVSPPPKPPQIQISDNKNLSKAERLILIALAQHQSATVSVAKVALMTGYSSKGGGFRNSLSSLRTKRYMQGIGGTIAITAAGVEALGDFEDLPTGRQLAEWWMERLPLAGRKIIETVILNRKQDDWSIADIAAVAGYDPTGGGFRNALSRLRTLGLIENVTQGVVRPSEELF